MFKNNFFKPRLALLITPIIILFCFRLYAQDTVSSKDVQFTPVESSPPAKATGTKPATTVNSVSQKTVKQAAKAIDLKQEKQQAQKSLWAIFIAGVAGGLIALLMPCIFPMLPLTVSFFTKSGEKQGSPVKKAVLYGLSIILIYVVLGLFITVIFGADALNSLSTNGVFNFGFFLLIVAFAASFFGAFEITLPSSWVNKMDENSDKGGIAGIFFMAATLALVSFSCTGPIIGTLLVQAATTGALLGPAVGMLGFALTLSIPFVLFALFPSLLKSLPKSGGWLNSVKVTLGFLELALSLKFLSNVDLAYHWHWFDREVFLVLWIVIFALMGLYLMGKLTFSHDSPLAYISVPRLFLAIIVLSFVVYMIPGLWGAPLKSISAYLPPKATQDFDLYMPQGSGATAVAVINDDVKPHKYASLFDKPKGFNPFFDYDEGVAFAKKVRKPVMIDFTGHACVNCRKMEENVWPDKQVYQTITQDYVLIQLYVDDKTDLAPGEQITTPEGKHLKTIANKWSDLQITKFNANSQPFYILLNPDTEEPLVAPEGADYNPQGFLKYLDSGLAAYK